MSNPLRSSISDQVNTGLRKRWRTVLITSFKRFARCTRTTCTARTLLIFCWLHTDICFVPLPSAGWDILWSSLFLWCSTLALLASSGNSPLSHFTSLAVNIFFLFSVISITALMSLLCWLDTDTRCRNDLIYLDSVHFIQVNRMITKYRLDPSW